jgi:hypothetical protein
MTQSPNSINPQCDPSAAGMIASRYAPADPATWFDAAMAAGISQQVMACPGGLQINLDPAPDAEGPADPEAEAFLFSWLVNTPGGMKALWHFLQARGVNVRRAR